MRPPFLARVVQATTFALLVALTSGRRASATEQGAYAATESRIAGSWVMAERGVTILVVASANGLWQGKITASPRANEVGSWILRDAKLDTATGTYHGKLCAPDAGEASVALWLSAPRTLTLTAKRFVFTKTFVWTRGA